jgi:hypothetical protein
MAPSPVRKTLLARCIDRGVALVGVFARRDALSAPADARGTQVVAALLASARRRGRVLRFQARTDGRRPERDRTSSDFGLRLPLRLGAGPSRRLAVDYIETFYNPIRLHSTLDYRSPVDYEKMKEEQQAASPTAVHRSGSGPWATCVVIWRKCDNRADRLRVDGSIGEIETPRTTPKVVRSVCRQSDRVGATASPGPAGGVGWPQSPGRPSPGSQREAF